MKIRSRRSRLFAVTLLFAAAALLTAGATGLNADEGMWPASEIKKLDLASKGFLITAEDILDPSRASLIYAVVQVGATGSFVSPDGLILTNHHVAFGAAQAASTVEHDYLKNGFLARTRGEEIEAKGMTVRITESFTDVSSRVLSAVKPGMAPVARTEAIRKTTRAIVAETEKANPGKKAEVSEMFPGKSYYLFIYSDIKDIRLVYVPQRSIGEFGGEDDNWMWPRHTGDFSFLRAYVSPDGRSVPYSPSNVPFRPRRWLKADPEGVKENDFVFLLGYPGRTFRHMTSHYLAYEQEVRMPYVVNWYSWQIDLMERMGLKDEAVSLQLASLIKGLSNTMKNYKGKIQGIQRAGTIDAKLREEKALQEWIDSDPGRKEKASGLLNSIGTVYDEMRNGAEKRMILGYLRSNVTLLSLAGIIRDAAVERAKPDKEREPRFTDKEYPQMARMLDRVLARLHKPTDKEIFRELLMRASRLGGKLGIPTLDSVISSADAPRSIDDFVNSLYETSRVADKTFLAQALAAPQGRPAESDPAVKIAAEIDPVTKTIRKTEDGWNGRLNELLPKLLDLKAAFLAKSFIPDANSTLRLTWGHIKGYSPRDAVHYGPMTTTAGILEKTTGSAPYNTPAGLIEMIKAGLFGKYKPQGLSSVPVCVLYDADTTGGNSGSPVLNAKGDLVALNFDRTFEATINDYAWSPDYSRSIGVDIRYILWVTEKFAGAGFLLDEMGVGQVK